jgi:molecular chaperone GrpE
MDQHPETETTPVLPAAQAAQEPLPVEAPAAAPAAGAAEEALAVTTKELERLQDRLLRLQAEFENYKRRMAREKVEFVKFANEELLLEFLPILDNLERAVSAARAEAASTPLLEGIEMVVRLFRSTLEKFGVEPIEALGQPFDPGLHQAVAQVESRDGQENLVVEEIQRGYRLEGRVLRAAMVRISRAASGPPGAGMADEGGRA